MRKGTILYTFITSSSWHGMAFIDLLYRFIKKALRILYAINRGQYGLISRK